MSSKLTTQRLDQAVIDKLTACSEAAMTAFSNAQGGAVSIAAALDTAAHIADMRDLFDMPQIKERIVALQDTPLGFRTDHDPRQKNRKTNEYNKPYDYPVVRDCAIEATLRGLQMVGNQWNIISYRCYVTKEGFEGLIRKVKGLSEFSPTLGVPREQTKGALIDCSATWALNGKAAKCVATIPVKMDDYSGADQILGKASRKFLKRCYEQMTGVSVPDGEEDSAPQISDAPAKPKRFSKPEAEAATPSNADLGPVAPLVLVPPADTGPVADPGPDALAPEQSDLQNFVVESCGQTFDTFRKAMAAVNWFPGHESWGGFGDVPAAACDRMLKAKRGLTQSMEAAAAK